MLIRPGSRRTSIAAFAIVVVAVSACGAGPTAVPAQPTLAGGVPAVSAVSPTDGTFNGYVQQVYSTGDFLLDTGHVTYAIVMSPTTAVVNTRGRQVPRQFITVAGPAEVTGQLTGSKVQAQKVVVPTRKDGA